MDHGSPKPRNTFTELLPVTFPTDASAWRSFTAAALLAKVSGNDVPNATKVMAVIESGSPRVHPKMDAISPTTIVRRPMNINATTKASQPPAMEVGGTAANNTWREIMRGLSVPTVFRRPQGTAPSKRMR